MRPIDFCTPKPFKLEHPYSVASRRSDQPARGLAALARGSLSSRSLSAPCPTTRTSASRAASPVRRRAPQATGGSGPPAAKRDRGEPRFTARFSLRRPVDRSRGRLLPSDVDRSRSPLTPLSPPPRSWAWGPSGSPTRWLGGRQDRLRPGLVKGARIPDPGCLPPSVATRIPSGPKRGRDHVAFAKARRSRDEDRRAEANRPPFAAGGLLRSRARAPPMVRLPFTRSVQRPGFRPDRYRWRASLSPRASCRFLQIRRRTGTHHEPRRFLVLRPGVTNLQPPSPSSAPSRGRPG